MKELLIFSLLAYAISNILVYGGIFYNFRQWIQKKAFKQTTGGDTVFTSTGNPLAHFVYEMLQCMMCTPMWVGFFLYFFLQPITLTVPTWALCHALVAVVYSVMLIPFEILFTGALASGTTWLIHTAQEALERWNKNDDNRRVL